MRDYKKILLCLDLTDDSEKITERARRHRRAQFRRDRAAARRRVRAGRTDGRGPAAGRADRGRTGRARDRSASRNWRRGLGLGSAERLVLTGNIKTEVVRAAQERGADLIVIGSRERHGMSILFNFTEDTVLHAAPCDVLAVRLSKTG